MSKSPFYKTGSSKSPLFYHHTEEGYMNTFKHYAKEAKKSKKTQSESDKYDYDKLTDQLRVQNNDTVFSSKSPHISSMKSQIYQINTGQRVHHLQTKKQTLDASGDTIYHTIVPKKKKPI